MQVNQQKMTGDQTTPAPADRIRAERFLIGAVLATISEQGEAGAPLGPMYAAMQTQGCTWNQWASLLSSLQRTGVVRLENDPVEEVPILAYITDLGRRVLNLLEQHRATMAH